MGITQESDLRKIASGLQDDIQRKAETATQEPLANLGRAVEEAGQVLKETREASGDLRTLLESAPDDARLQQLTEQYDALGRRAGELDSTLSGLGESAKRISDAVASLSNATQLAKRLEDLREAVDGRDWDDVERRAEKSRKKRHG